MIKAIKEARLHTSLGEPNQGMKKRWWTLSIKPWWERTESISPALVPFAGRIAHAGMINSLAQVILKIASPGVPDFYQGTELWDLNWWIRITAGPWTMNAGRVYWRSSSPSASPSQSPSFRAAKLP